MVTAIHTYSHTIFNDTDIMKSGQDTHIYKFFGIRLYKRIENYKNEFVDGLEKNSVGFKRQG